MFIELSYKPHLAYYFKAFNWRKKEYKIQFIDTIQEVIINETEKKIRTTLSLN